MELVTFVSTDKTSGTLLCKLSMHSPSNILGNTEAVIVTHLIIYLQKEKKKALKFRQEQHCILHLIFIPWNQLALRATMLTTFCRLHLPKGNLSTNLLHSSFSASYNGNFPANMWGTTHSLLTDIISRDKSPWWLDKADEEDRTAYQFYLNVWEDLALLPARLCNVVPADVLTLSVVSWLWRYTSWSQSNLK